MGKIIIKTQSTNPELSVGEVAKTKADGIVSYGKTYEAVEQEVGLFQRVRVHPTIDAMTPSQRIETDKLAKDYMTFLRKVQTSSDATEMAEILARRNGFFKEGRFLHHPEDTTFALIKPGTAPVSEGLRIIFSHNDSPCLRLKPTPLLFQWDTDLRDMHTGLRFDTFPYGNPQNYQYSGRNVTIRGEVFPINGRKRKIEFRGIIPGHSVHVDPRTSETSFQEAHLGEDLDVSTHFSSKEEFLEEFKLESDDFLSSRLFVLPDVVTEMQGNYIYGYGHDAKIGLYTSMRALFESKPQYTTLLIGFDREEAGSGGTSGARGKFLEDVIINTLSESPEFVGNGINERTIRGILNRSYAINADVDVGATSIEESNVRYSSVGILGRGVGILGQDGEWDSDQVSQRLIAKVRRVFRKAGIISQGIGNPQSVDAGTVPTFGDYLTNRGIETLCLPCVVGGLHNTTEVIHKGDLYYAFEGYKALLETGGAWDNNPVIVRK